jgi:hypothetical protein
MGNLRALSISALSLSFDFPDTRTNVVTCSGP